MQPTKPHSATDLVMLNFAYRVTVLFESLCLLFTRIDRPSWEFEMHKSRNAIGFLDCLDFSYKD